MWFIEQSTLDTVKCNTKIALNLPGANCQLKGVANLDWGCLGIAAGTLFGNYLWLCPLNAFSSKKHSSLKSALERLVYHLHQL